MVSSLSMIIFPHGGNVKGGSAFSIAGVGSIFGFPAGTEQTGTVPTWNEMDAIVSRRLRMELSAY
jgi:hypothetical protein